MMKSEKDRRRKSSARRIHRAVRQILFNELGLNREGVRNLVIDVVMNATQSQVRDQEKLYNTIEAALSRMIYGKYHTHELRLKLQKAVEDHIKKLVEVRVDAILKDRLRIIIEGDDIKA